MNKLSLKGKILFALFSMFLIISSISFNFEKMIIAIISLIIAIICASLLIIEQK